jgi:uncharacterized protein
MNWSHYNTLFYLADLGYYVHNALSNKLIEVDKNHFDILCRLQNNEIIFNELIDHLFIDFLKNNSILTSGDIEDKVLLSNQYKRFTNYFDTTRLDLTICPTLRCNFKCSYCFEGDHESKVIMTSKTVNRLIEFIKNRNSGKDLSIEWYGGEPLLAFGVICDFTEKIQKLDINFISAGMVTNGYLLDKEKVNTFNNLNINSIQITLDAPKEVHDIRRTLAGGGATYHKILNNIEMLMSSTYQGECIVRVNVDKCNLEDFMEFRSKLLEGFVGKKLSVYAGRINGLTGYDKMHSCGLNKKEWSDYIFDIYKQHSVMPFGGFYPSSNIDVICVASMNNGFVVGPEGELYKCWEDVGDEEMIIGSIYKNNAIYNSELEAMYSIGTDVYASPGCIDCKVLPICDGGCPKKWVRSKHSGNFEEECCSQYKYDLISYLEMYIKNYRIKQACEALLSISDSGNKNIGYHVISP